MLSSIGSLGKVSATPTSEDCDWERGPSPACQKPLIHCHRGWFSPPWKCRELTSVEVFQKDLPSLSPSHTSSQPSVVKYQLISVGFPWMTGYDTDAFILKNSCGRSENTVRVSLLNSFDNYINKGSQYAAGQGYRQSWCRGIGNQGNQKLTEEKNKLGRMLITTCELTIFWMLLFLLLLHPPQPLALF